MRIYDCPTARGHFGPYGGIFVAETLTAALEECASLTSARARIRRSTRVPLRAEALRSAPQSDLSCKKTH